MDLNVLEIPERKQLDYREYVKRRAAPEDCSIVIDQPTVLTHKGKVIAIYTLLEDDAMPILAACNSIRYDKTLRTNGLKTTSRVFGYLPRNVLRQDFCNVTSLAKEAPAANKIISEFGAILTDHYKRYAPDTFQEHEVELGAKIKDEYRIPRSVFTSGIINKNNPLKYHFDTGNIRDVFSVMLVLRESVDGGLLCLPEFDVAFFLQNKALFMFDGQGILHGVTPMTIREGGYRYSLVYYAMMGLWKCLTLSEEMARIKNLRTDREIKRAAK